MVDFVFFLGGSIWLWAVVRFFHAVVRGCDSLWFVDVSG